MVETIREVREKKGGAASAKQDGAAKTLVVSKCKMNVYDRGDAIGLLFPTPSLFHFLNFIFLVNYYIFPLLT